MMARNDRTAAGPYWTRNWIEKMWRFTAENFVDFDTGSVDFEALGREEYEFRKALFYRKFKNSPRAKEAFEEAGEGYRTNVENGKKGGRPRKDATTPDDKHDDQEAPSRGGSAATFRGSAKNQGASNTGSTVPAVRPESGNISEARQSQTREGEDSMLRASDGHRSPSRTLPLPSWEEFLSYIDGEGLDYTDAREWWEMTMVDRAGKDRDGKPIKNWKMACRRFCEAKAQKRRSA